LLLILLVLVGLAVRLDAAPAADPIALARRYADILTGDDPGDDVRDPDEADEADEATAIAPAGTAPTGDAGVRSGARRAASDDDEEREDRAAGEGGAAGESAAGDDGLQDPYRGEGDPGGEPGALALLDAEQAPLDATTIEAARTASASAGAAEAYESWMRRLRPSLWGRLDVGVSWRRRWSQPRFAPAVRSDEVWLFATWRR